MPSSFRSFAPAGFVNQDLSHKPRGNTKKMRSTLKSNLTLIH
nr:C585 [uncultured bacterium]